MNKRRQTVTLIASLGAVAVMLGLVAASVPLYSLFCRVTGTGGTVRIADHAKDGPLGRAIVVRFDTSLGKGLAWKFEPLQRRITTHLGEQTLAIFTATNLSDKAITGTATFNVTPDKVGRYFNKIQCFCFTEQRLEPGQSVHMPVTFFVDPALGDDDTTDEVSTITLSYTFFDIQDRQGRS